MIRISEKFLSLEGEGPLTGEPTFYIRLVGCNKTCSGFNNPCGKTIQHNKKGFDPVLGFDPAEYKSLKDLPPVTVGCDTIYSISDSRFKHLWTKTTFEECFAGVDMNRVNLSITGGEPMLWQDKIAEMLVSDWFCLLRIPNIILETNCSIEPSLDLLSAIDVWETRTGGFWVWSNSPKLSVSGETRNSSIIPVVPLKQISLGVRWQYFKFVTDGSQESIDEIKSVVLEYKAAGLFMDGKVWLMPMACNKEQQDAIARKVADICIREKWKFAFRLQNQLWSNEVGT